jgi:hypothetical protein
MAIRPTYHAAETFQCSMQSEVWTDATLADALSQHARVCGL